MKPKLQNCDRDNEKTILPEVRSRLIHLFLLSPVSIFVKRNCLATTATLVVNSFQAVKHKIKWDLEKKMGAFSGYLGLVPQVDSAIALRPMCHFLKWYTVTTHHGRIYNI